MSLLTASAALPTIFTGFAVQSQSSEPWGRVDCRIVLDFRDSAIFEIREASKEAELHNDALREFRYRSDLSDEQKERFDALIDAVEGPALQTELASFLDDLLKDRCSGRGNW